MFLPNATVSSSPNIKHLEGLIIFHWVLKGEKKKSTFIQRGLKSKLSEPHISYLFIELRVFTACPIHQSQITDCIRLGLGLGSWETGVYGGLCHSSFQWAILKRCQQSLKIIKESIKKIWICLCVLPVCKIRKLNIKARLEIIVLGWEFQRPPSFSHKGQEDRLNLISVWDMTE